MQTFHVRPRARRRRFTFQDLERLFESINADMSVDIEQPPETWSVPSEEAEGEQPVPAQEGHPTTSSLDIATLLQRLAANWARQQASRHPQRLAEPEVTPLSQSSGSYLEPQATLVAQDSMQLGMEEQIL